MFDFEARDSKGKQAAVRRLSSIISIGAEAQQAVIQKVLKRSIVDRLVDPQSAEVTSQSGRLYMRYEKTFTNDHVFISDNALGQMCKVTGIPKTYVNKLMASEPECVGMDESTRYDLITHLFTTHFHEGQYLDRRKQRAKFLHRLMDGHLYGFLSRNFNRKLGTKDMLRPFLERCTHHGAKPSEAHIDAVKTSIKCTLPVIFEPIDGEFVAFGATYTNSDFGVGSLEVNGSILRITSGTTTVLDSKLRKVHLGALITDEDIELSEETMEKESATHMSAVKDMVDHVFSTDELKKTLDLIRFAADHKVSWETLKAKARELLNKAELAKLEELLNGASTGVIDLPPVTTSKAGDAEANAWWAAAALGHIAVGVQDVERKVGIQELAGNLLK